MPAANVALVTGGSRGLGLACAERLLADGWRVAIMARSDQVLEEAQRHLRSVAGARQWVGAFQGDVASQADITILARTLEKDGHAIGALVCCAGIYGPIGLVEDTDWSDWAETIRVNLLGTVLACRAVLPAMKRRRAGRIVLLSGGGATGPRPHFGAYAASKAAVVRFMETLAAEVADAGIKVNAVAPGALNTRMLDQVLVAGTGQAGYEAYAQAVRQRDDGGASIERAAELVAYLASEHHAISGRLLSAVWDDCRAIAEQTLSDDAYTLRRVTA